MSCVLPTGPSNPGVLGLAYPCSPPLTTVHTHSLSLTPAHTHTFLHPPHLLTLTLTCSQEPTLCVSSPPLHSETSRGTLSSAAVGVFTRSRQQTLQIRPDPFGSRSPFTTHHRLRLVFPAPGEFLGWPRDFLVPVRRKAFPALLSHKNTVS